MRRRLIAALILAVVIVVCVSGCHFGVTVHASPMLYGCERAGRAAYAFALRCDVPGRGMVLNETGCSRSSCPCHSAREILTAGAVLPGPAPEGRAVATARDARPVHPDDRLGRRAQWHREQ
jgi:hypothetical protein